MTESKQWTVNVKKICCQWLPYVAAMNSNVHTLSPQHTVVNKERNSIVMERQVQQFCLHKGQSQKGVNLEQKPCDSTHHVQPFLGTERNGVVYLSLQNQ